MRSHEWQCTPPVKATATEEGRACVCLRVVLVIYTEVRSCRIPFQPTTSVWRNVWMLTRRTRTHPRPQTRADVVYFFMHAFNLIQQKHLYVLAEADFACWNQGSSPSRLLAPTQLSLFTLNSSTLIISTPNKYKKGNWTFYFPKRTVFIK